MTRWSVRNLLLPVSHEQFVDLTTQFKKAAELSFGTECKLSIRALRAPKKYTTFHDKDIQEDLDEENKANTICETENLGNIGKALWNKAAYVEVTVRPVDAKKAPNYAFGHMGFKGERSRQVTFYIQPDGEYTRNSVLSQNRLKLVGDGLASNGSRSPRYQA